MSGQSPNGWPFHPCDTDRPRGTFPSVGKFFDGLDGIKREIREHHGLGCWVKP